MSGELLSTSQVAQRVNRDKQTVVNWDKYSTKLLEVGKDRLIPEPQWIDGCRYWTEEQVDDIINFSRTITYGSLAEFNRTKWGKRGKRTG